MEDQSQAISFANSYFSLVDGLAAGLENHLAETVVLDWFGRTIKGRKNVTEFMKLHKVGSRHVFNSIKPIRQINYNKYSQQNSRKTSEGKLIEKKSDLDLKPEFDFDRLSISENNNNNVISKDLNEVFADSEEISMTYELGENDLANLFAIEIRPTVAEDIEESINKIKLNEEKQVVVKSREKLGDDLIESIKYVEANGQIVFSKKSYKRGTDLHTWRRQSQLQIAYSLITNESVENREELENDEDIGDDEIMEITDEIKWPYSEESMSDDNNYKKPRLPSLGEITDISNNLVPNINNFGGYFSSSDFLTERDNFLENFNAELTMRNLSPFLRTPQYVDNRLVFTDTIIIDKPAQSRTTFNNPDDDNNKNIINNKSIDQGNGFVFNYLIHLIIYQGSSRCRRSLNQEFAITNRK